MYRGLHKEKCYYYVRGTSFKIRKTQVFTHNKLYTASGLSHDFLGGVWPPPVVLWA